MMQLLGPLPSSRPAFLLAQKRSWGPDTRVYMHHDRGGLGLVLLLPSVHTAGLTVGVLPAPLTFMDINQDDLGAPWTCGLTCSTPVGCSCHPCAEKGSFVSTQDREGWPPH